MSRIGAAAVLAVASIWILGASTPSDNPKETLTTAAPDVDWPLRGGNHQEQHQSALAQIDTKNVDRLGLAWVTDIPSLDGLLATPIVVNGTVFISGSSSQVYAVDALSGARRWTFEPVLERDKSINSSWATRVNRGVAVDDGRVFVGTGDCRLIALDAESGKELWEIRVCQPEDNYSITGAPRVGAGLVFIGSGGSDHSVRGFAAAFDAKTGKEVWRFFTVPGDPAKGYENAAMAMAAKTWTGEAPWQFGGGAVWEGITYDPELSQVYIGVAGGSPWDPTVRSPDGGDNLFLCSIVALDAKTGEYVWHYQQVPRDAWDFDAAMPMMLATLDVDGETRPVVMQAPKNGFFYVLDRRDGRLLRAKNYVQVSWAERIDLETGRPVEKPGARYHENESGEATVFPSIWGAHSWQPMSYSSRTGLVYIPALDFPTVFRMERGALMGGIFADLYGYDPHDPNLPKDLGKLVAWDPIEQTERWRVDSPYPFNGGTLATDGGIVFQGTASGEIQAFDSETGQSLWSASLGSAVQAGPATYLRDGRQFLLVAAGWGGSPRTMTPAYAASFEARGPARLFAFELDAQSEMPATLPYPRTIPRPPAARTGKPDEIARGAKLFDAMSCSMCHGQGVEGALGGSIPDLRYLSKAAYDDWFEIVLRGKRSAAGMLAFEAHMDEPAAAALRAYVLEVAWDAHEANSSQ